MAAVREQLPDVKYGRVCEAVAERTDLPGFGFDNLIDMATHGFPKPDHMASYARMIADASFTRQLSEAAREAIATTAEQGTAAGDLQRVGEVLERHTQRVLDGFAAPWPTRPPTNTDVSERTRLEERMVASLMAYPQQAKELLAVIQPEELQDFRCRTAYEYLTGDTTPVHVTNELELRFEIQSRQESYGPIPTEDDLLRRERDEAFIYRLAHTPVDTRSGKEAAQTLRAYQREEAMPGIASPVAMELHTAPVEQTVPGLRP